MTITFENDKDVIVHPLEKIISFVKANQYLFVVNCAWCIAGIIGLDSGLTNIINNPDSRRRVGQHHQISTTPRDIARSESVDPEETKLEELIIQNKGKNIPRVSRIIRSNPAGGIQKLSRKERKRIAKSKSNQGF
jgi:hypothetical protein